MACTMCQSDRLHSSGSTTWIEPLDPSFGARERPFLFQARTSRQDDVGKPARVAEEDFLNDEELEFRERFSNVVRIGVRDLEVLAEQVQRLECAAMNGVDDLLVIEAFRRRQLRLPSLFETG